MPDVLQEFKDVRDMTCDLVRAIEKDQLDLQVCSEVSPAKWHLGHTTWFFEYFLLKDRPKFAPFNKNYFKLFNSYYKGAGEHIEQCRRGELVKESYESVLHYREEIDKNILKEFFDFSDEKKLLLTIGLHHEKQHQELILMDILRTYFEKNLIYDHSKVKMTFEKTPLKMKEFSGGLVMMGEDFSDQKFCYDNETPKHKVFVAPFKMGSRLVSNIEYQEFIDQGGYKDANLWLSDGWKWILENNITSPLYWNHENEFTLQGMNLRDPHAPVRHLSYYEAQAFARFKGKRLPTEYEWEFVSKEQLDSLMSFKHGLSFDWTRDYKKDFADLFGTLWQWTQSAYLPYPGYKWQKDLLGEYNGKFMVNQMVLRGGAFATPDEHLRATYRNFFYPWQRWAFTGLRLAEDL